MPPIREKLLDSAIVLGLITGVLLFVGRIALESRMQGLDLPFSFTDLDATNLMVLGAADLIGLIGTLLSTKGYTHDTWLKTFSVLGFGLAIGYGVWKKKHLVTAWALVGLGVSIVDLVATTERFGYVAKAQRMEACLRSPTCAKAEAQLAIDDRTSRTVRGVFVGQSADFVVIYTGAGYEACPKPRLLKLFLPARPGTRQQP